MPQSPRKRARAAATSVRRVANALRQAAKRDVARPLRPASPGRAVATGPEVGQGFGRVRSAADTAPEPSPTDERPREARGEGADHVTPSPLAGGDPSADGRDSTLDRSGFLALEGSDEGRRDLRRASADDNVSDDLEGPASDHLRTPGGHGFFGGAGHNPPPIEPMCSVSDALLGPDNTLEDVGLSARARNSLHRVGFHTLGAITERSRSELDAIPNLGVKTLIEIETTLARHGLALRSEIPPVSGGEAPDARADPPGAPRPQSEGSAGDAAKARHRDPDPRLTAMVERRLGGATLAEIGEEYGISRGRVTQILKAAGVSASTARQGRLDLQSGEVEERGDLVLQAFRQGDSPAQIAALLRLRRSLVRRFLRANVSSADRAARRANNQRPTETRYDDVDLVAAVREVGQRYGRAPTSAEYNRAAAGGMLPSLPTVHARLGWSHAVELAGFQASRARRPYTRRWTEGACRQALRRLVVESGEVPSTNQYDALAQLDDELPSLATIRHRLGRWTTVTGELARLPRRSDILDRLATADPDHNHADAAAMWMAYLEEVLSVEDLVVLLITGDFVWNAEFGSPPAELADAVRDASRRADGSLEVDDELASDPTSSHGPSDLEGIDTAGLLRPDAAEDDSRKAT